MTRAPKEIIESLRTGNPLNVYKLERLRDFTKMLVLYRGQVEENEIIKFLNAGYSMENVIEIIGGISVKLISNYINIIARTPLDDIMKKYEWEKCLNKL